MPPTRTQRRASPDKDAMLHLARASTSDSTLHYAHGAVPGPSSDATPASASSSTSIFPPPPANPTPRRPSHHKKRPASHIPRPPNAFILFRANFIRDRHLHTAGSGPLSNVSPTALSTIVGITWRNLPEEERQIWQEKARIAREEHKVLHPSYRYQPLPSAEERAMNRENKRKVKEENIPKPDLERCNEISRLLVQGYRGEELEAMVAQFDQNRPKEANRSSAANGNHPVRSASLPTPPRRRNSRRPRAHSASNSPPAGSTDLGSSAETPYLYEYGSPFASSPELHAGLEQTPSIAIPSLPSLPDLTYDEASPSSINLPDPQEGVYSHQPHYLHLPSTPRGTTHSLRPTPLAVSTTDPFSSSTSFSALTSWDQSHPTATSYHQFSYFASGFQTNDTLTTSDAHLTPPTPAATNADPYASSIPPFDLYHTLKSFEQPLCGLSTTPSAFHVFDNEPFYEVA